MRNREERGELLSRDAYGAHKGAQGTRKLTTELNGDEYGKEKKTLWKKKKKCGIRHLIDAGMRAEKEEDRTENKGASQVVHLAIEPEELYICK